MRTTSFEQTEVKESHNGLGPSVNPELRESKPGANPSFHCAYLQMPTQWRIQKDTACFRQTF